MLGKWWHCALPRKSSKLIFLNCWKCYGNNFLTIFECYPLNTEKYMRAFRDSDWLYTLVAWNKYIYILVIQWFWEYTIRYLNFLYAFEPLAKEMQVCKKQVAFSIVSHSISLNNQFIPLTRNHWITKLSHVFSSESFY